MSTVIGRYRPPHQPVSLVNTTTGRQIQFDEPHEFLERLQQNPEWGGEILTGQWVWSIQEVQGGH